MKTYYGVFRIDRPLFTYLSDSNVITGENKKLEITLATDFLFDDEQKAQEFVGSYKQIGLLIIQPVYITGFEP